MYSWQSVLECVKEEGGDETRRKNREKDRDGKIEKQSTGPTGFSEWHQNVFSNMIDIAGSRFLGGSLLLVMKCLAVVSV